jgi:hypothetical protein
MSTVTDSLGGHVLAQLLDRTTRGARLAAVIAVALVAGFGVATAVGAPGATRLVTVVAGDQGPGTDDPVGATDEATDSPKPEKSAQPDKTGKPEKAGKPATTEKQDEAGTAGEDSAGGEHGACVSKVAQDAGKVGGPHQNHGWAVSRAAHTCPHPTPTSTGG